MKAKLIFDTTDPDDRQEFLRCSKSRDMALALWGIIHLRKKLEQSFEAQDIFGPDFFNGIEEFAEGISNILNEYNINVDQLA